MQARAMTRGHDAARLAGDEFGASDHTGEKS